MIWMPIQTMMAMVMKLQSRHQTQISEVLGFLVCLFEGLVLIPSFGVSVVNVVGCTENSGIYFGYFHTFCFTF